MSQQVEHEHPFLKVLYERGTLERPERPRIRAVPDLPPATTGDPQLARYAAAALAKECAKVAAAPEGVRNHTLNSAAFSIGQLVAAGHLGAETAVDHLVDAGLSCGLGPVEVNRTIRHAVKDGAGQPREVRLDPMFTAPDAATFDPFTADQSRGGDAVTSSVTPGVTSGEGVDDLFDGPGPVDDDDGEPAGETSDPMRHPQVSDGERFIFQVEADEPAIWGKGHQVLWSPGEALMITGPPGVGKTTVAQQLTLARIGLTDEFLGFPVQTTSSKVLYLAMDRPRQIARSIRRMVDDGDRGLLAERLVVWRGPLPGDVAVRPEIMLSMAEALGCDTLIVDSVKDAAVGLVDSERAGIYNRARQRALAGGIEVVEIAHQRKGGANNGAPKSLQDVHGGMELTAGAGSVFLVWGAAGDLVVEFNHLKQPAELIGPLHLLHDHEAGRTAVDEMPDAGDLLRAEPWKVWSVPDLAAALSESAGKPSRGDVERVRRKVEKLAEAGLAMRVPGDGVTRAGKPEVRYRWMSTVGDTTWDAS